MNRVARLSDLFRFRPHGGSRNAPGGAFVLASDERAAARRGSSTDERRCADALYPMPRTVRAIPIEPPVLANGSKPPKENLTHA